MSRLWTRLVGDGRPDEKPMSVFVWYGGSELQNNSRLENKHKLNMQGGGDNFESVRNSEIMRTLEHSGISIVLVVEVVSDTYCV